MRKVLSELKEFRVWIIVSFFGIMLSTMSDIVLPTLFSKIINAIEQNPSSSFAEKISPVISSNGKLMILVVGITILGAIVGNFGASRVGTGLAKKLRSKIFGKVQTFTEAEMNKFTTGSLITRNTNDVTQVQQFVGMFIRMFVRAPIIMAGSIFMALTRNARLAVPLIFAVPLIVVIVFLISRFIMPLFTKLQSKIDTVNVTLREQLTGVRVVRAFVNDKHEEKRFDEINREHTKLSLKTYRIMSLMNPLLTVVLNLTVISVLMLVANDIYDGIPIIEGDIVAMIQYVSQVLFSFIMLSMIFVMYPRAEASAKRIYEVLDTIPSIKDLNNPTEITTGIRGTFEFKNVSFCFPEATKPVLEGINLKIEEGKTTAIIGSTGSGKSTLLRLMLRFYDVTQGQILLNGVDVRELTQKDIRDRIGYVPQSWQLFRGTIEENIKFGNADANFDEVKGASIIAQAFDFIANKKAGFAHMVEQGGANFSGGQKQRLSIARAIVREPEIYLFDDSFSALDAATDQKLRNALDADSRGITKIIVGQRVASIAQADNIIVLDKGRIVGSGKHKELLESCEIYKEIAESQFSQEEEAV